MNSQFLPSSFLNLQRTEHAKLFDLDQPVWFALKAIAPYLESNLNPAMAGKRLGQSFIGENVFIGEGTLVEHGAVIKGPAWIGSNSQIRSGAYIRENVLIGNGVVIGNSCELKNSIVFDQAEIPHFNYVGDSILGFKSHLGAGVILSNVKLDRQEVILKLDGGKVLPTGLRKFGAVVGDHSEIGCHSVLNPGSLLGRHCIMYPGVQWRGILQDHQIVKLTQHTQVIERNEVT